MLHGLIPQGNVEPYIAVKSVQSSDSSHMYLMHSHIRRHGNTEECADIAQTLTNKVDMTHMRVARSVAVLYTEIERVAE